MGIIKMKCKKVDLRKVNFNKPLLWNVWNQFGIDINKIEKEMNPHDYIMPKKELTEMKLLSRMII